MARSAAAQSRRRRRAVAARIPGHRCVGRGDGGCVRGSPAQQQRHYQLAQGAVGVLRCGVSGGEGSHEDRSRVRCESLLRAAVSSSSLGVCGLSSPRR